MVVKERAYKRALGATSEQGNRPAFDGHKMAELNRTYDFSCNRKQCHVD